MASQPTAVEAAIRWLSALNHTPSTPHEALALLTHALLLGHGFRLANEQAASSSSSTTTPATNNIAQLPSGWGVGGWGGQYRHERSSLTFEVRVTAIAGRVVVNAAAAESSGGDDGDVQRLEVKVGDFVNVGERGKVVGFEDLEKEEGEEEMKNRWKDCFKKLEDYATLVQVNISHKLVPDAAKAGYEAAAAAGGSAGVGRGGGGVRVGEPSYTPMPMPGPRPVPPVGGDDDDPLRIGGPMRPPIRVPPRMGDPYGVGLGHDDLHPAGLPGPGALNPPGFGGVGGEAGGMLMGPNHPYFRRGRGGRMGGVGGPRGGPPVPGARYDPIGPPGPPDGTYGDDQPDPARFGNNPDIETPPPSDMYW